MFVGIFPGFCGFSHFSMLSARSWTALGRSWGVLGYSWGAPGRSWGAPGRSWGAPGTLLGPSWGRLRPILQKICPQEWAVSLFGPPTWEAKWRPKSLKIDLKRQRVFRHVFFTICLNFLLIFGSKLRWYFGSLGLNT